MFSSTQMAQQQKITQVFLSLSVQAVYPCTQAQLRADFYEIWHTVL